MKTIGAYEAKTHLPALLDEVAAGGRIQITKHGKPIAILIPAEEMPDMSVKEAIATLKELRKGRTLGGISIREMIEEGRQ